MTLRLTGIGPAKYAPELCGFGDQFVVVLSGTKDECRAMRHLLFEAVSLEVAKGGQQ